MITYTDIKALAKENGQKVEKYISMATANDPFYAGNTPSTKAAAEWFAKIWKEYGFTSGTHLRKVHYKLISQREPVIKPDGKEYENTSNDWAYICAASKYARYLGLVDYKDIVDRKAPQPKIYTAYELFQDERKADFHELDYDLPNLKMRIEKPEPYIEGFKYSTNRQPYHLEVWIEKSTMDEYLIRPCREYEANLVVGEGFQSITNTILMLQRIREAKKPGIIFYISDLDPAGVKMPPSIARQAEYWREREFPDVDVKIKQIALTLNQAFEYDLPRSPVKATDKRKDNFEEKYGRGATELDALEALYPGELEKIVSEHLSAYYDEKLERKYQEAEYKARSITASYMNETIGDELEEIDLIKWEISTIVDRYQGIKGELEPLEERLIDLESTISDKLEDIDIDVDLPELPKPEVEEMDERYWLFDSNRDYLEQLRFYEQKST